MESTNNTRILVRNLKTLLFQVPLVPFKWWLFKRTVHADYRAVVGEEGILRKPQMGCN